MLVLDDHGAVFVYSEEDWFVHLADELGFERRKNELIYDADHFHFCPAAWSGEWDGFVEGLALQQVS
jgi:hypothetical protein